MAFSQSIGKAQSPTVCQFCEESSEIKWKCINCELFLCQLCCSKIHSKSKASMEHEIINLKQFETEDFATSMRKVELENMECTIHAKQKCFVYCEDCSQFACSKCLLETHKTHDYKDLPGMYIEIISEMKDLMKQFEFNLHLFKNEKGKLLKLLSEGDSNFQKTRETILKTEKEMKEAISKHAKDLLQELDGKWKPSENMMKTELSALTKKENELATRTNNLNQALQSHQVQDIFSTRRTLDKSLQKHSVKQIHSKRTKFIPRNIKMEKGSLLVLGDLFTVPEMELIETYQSDFVNVSNILFYHDNTAFLGSFSSEILQRVAFENDKIKLKKGLKIQVFDMALINDAEMVLSFRKCDLKLYTKYGLFKSFLSFTPLTTSCVYVTKDNNLIVGLTESSPIILPPPNDCIRKLVVMNKDGDTLHTIQHDRDNRRMLTYPYRIKTFHDKIIVVDIINQKNEGRIVMCDNWGQLHWTFNGCINNDCDQVKFYPIDVAITSTDLILISDCYNHAIHVLNTAGQAIECKNVKCIGIEIPTSLCVDNKNDLWVGVIQG